MTRVAGSHISDVNIRTAVIDGGAAGDHTVTGLSIGDSAYKADVILSVVYIAATLANSADLSSEFGRAPSAANTINNTGGTDTTSGILIVTYIDQDY
jgi:hypothetical protein